MATSSIINLDAVVNSCSLEALITKNASGGSKEHSSDLQEEEMILAVNSYISGIAQLSPEISPFSVLSVQHTSRSSKQLPNEF